MVKFEKRVAKHKISRFLETTPLIVFFHYIDANTFYKKLSNSLIFKKYVATLGETNKKSTLFPELSDFNCSAIEKANKKKLTAKQNLSSSNKSNNSTFNQSEIKDCIALEKLVIKLVKNNYAKKALIDDKSFSAKQSSKDNATFVNINQKNNKVNSFSKLDLQKDDIITLLENKGLSENRSFSDENQIDNTFLFQGNHLLMGFQDVSCLADIKDVIEDKKIDILGAIYKNCVIDQNKVRKLASICNDKQVYQNLTNTTINPMINLSSQLMRNLSFSYLSFFHYKLVALIKQSALKSSQDN